MSNTPPSDLVKNPSSSALAAPAFVSSARFRKAYEQRLGEFGFVRVEDLLQIQIDITAGVTTTLGCVPHILALRDEVVSELPFFPIAKMDDLESLALALGYSHTLYVAASEPVGPIQAYAEELTKTRDTFTIDVTALAQRGLVDGARLKELRGTNGYKNVAWDTMTLVAMFRTHWDAVSGKTGVTLADLDRAEDLADKLTTAVGLREREVKAASEAHETRQRAYTLFVNAYDEVRRALSYLRWHKGDLEEIAPSLFSNRRAPKKADEANPVVAAPPAAPPVTTPAAPSPGGGNGGGGNGGGSNGGGSNGGGVIISATPLPGTPGSPPFNR